MATGVSEVSELVSPGVPGLHFELGNSQDLIQKVQWMLDHLQVFADDLASSRCLS